MTAYFRALIRASLLCAHLISGVLLALLFLTKPLKSLNLYDHRTLIKRWLWITGYFTGCRVKTTLKPLLHPTLVISNHISWLDILILGGNYPIRFLSKDDVAKWPIIGFLTKISGTLLIKRGSGAQGAINEITHSLMHHHSVAIFPEGTTTNGSSTKSFHSRLLKSAYLSHASISIISLSYSTDGKSRDLKMGWTKQSFLQHVFYVLSQKRTLVQINLVKVLTDFEHIKRKELAKQCQSQVNFDLNNNHFPLPPQEKPDLSHTY